jgi:hypothetical protein
MVLRAAGQTSSSRQVTSVYGVERPRCERCPIRCEPRD